MEFLILGALIVSFCAAAWYISHVSDNPSRRRDASDSGYGDASWSYGSDVGGDSCGGGDGGGGGGGGCDGG